MHVIKGINKVISFDVDETLIMQEYSGLRRGQWVRIGSEGVSYQKNQNNIDELVLAKNRGATIVVWSGSGWQWAEKVVKALNIEDYVDYIQCKPQWIFDDQDPNEWTKRVHKG